MQNGLRAKIKGSGENPEFRLLFRLNLKGPKFWPEDFIGIGTIYILSIQSCTMVVSRVPIHSRRWHILNWIGCLLRKLMCAKQIITNLVTPVIHKSMLKLISRENTFGKT